MTQEPDDQDVKKAKDDTNPFGRTITGRPTKFQRRAIAMGVAAIVILGLILIFRPFRATPPAAITPGDAGKKTRQALPPTDCKDRLTAQLRVNEISALETVARRDKQRLLELFNLLQATGSIEGREGSFHDLSDRQIETLRQKARKGGAESADFLSRLERYRSLKKRIAELEKRLGHYRSVESGDTHFQIAYDFLVGEAGKSPPEAQRILQDTLFQEPLLPGFKVWNFWLPDGFCTFVTQGSAPLTPAEIARQAKDTALARLNSLYYIVGSSSDLLERKILSGGFLKSTRLADIPPGQFHLSIDLRSQQHIRVHASALKMKKVSALTIFPRDFTAGKDYTVRQGPRGRWLQLTILKKSVFRGRRIVIAIE